MIYNVLNGDGLANEFDLKGDKIVCREILIEGSLQSQSLVEFWKLRENFIKSTFQAENYSTLVKAEFEKLSNLKPNDEVNLWFGDDAFCQVNMWFCLWLCLETSAKIYRVFPDSNSWKCNFNNLTKCLESRKLLTNHDLMLGKQLWKAFSENDSEGLKILSITKTNCFNRLSEVCNALIEKNQKPKEILREIIKQAELDFNKIFLEFQKKASIYGFGDAQVKSIFAEIELEI
jgi:hypothetical protein